MLSAEASLRDAKFVRVRGGEGGAETTPSVCCDYPGHSRDTMEMSGGVMSRVVIWLPAA